mmetsp:Transcript_55640/g.143348  ORF Transcript_55640/g.143348 Transcript_55640/m.143348 type:complete len:590 (-) Transcript_55640:76-1845(-)
MSAKELATALDIATFPTMARYDIRPDVEVKTKSDIETAQDDSEHLLALMDQQVRIAEQKFRSGSTRQAIDILHRAHGIAEEGTKHGIAANLAKAVVRLQLCGILSGIGRHAQALSEVRQGKRELDELLRVLQGATREAEVAWGMGDFTRPAKHLQRLLRNPPTWMRRMVEVSVQTRQAICIELEFVEGTQVLPGAQVGANEMKEEEEEDGQGDDEDEGFAIGEGMPVPKRTVAEEIEQLHAEALAMSQQLLPASSPVRQRAEKVMTEKKTREVEHVWASTRGRRESLRARAMSPAGGSAGKVGKDPLGPTPSTASTSFTGRGLDSRGSCMNTSQSSWQNMSLGSTGSSINLDQSDKGHPRINRGDVLEYSMPSRSRPQTTRASSAELKARKKGSASSKDQDEHLDPFSSWKKSVVDVGKMSLKQLTMRTDQGQRDLQADLKLEKRRFLQVDLKMMDDDRLFDNRTLYNGYGVMTTRRSERRKAAWKQRDWGLSTSGMERKEETHDSFAHYGVKFSSSEPSLKDYRKLLQKSLERNPVMEAQRKHEDKERRMAEEDQKQTEQEQKADLFKGSFGGLKRGKTGEAIFQFTT